ncbi:siderophore-interacting protein [Marmoricola sp. RAF53]|uniref:siderophore-interacting protein n=1 Tax=Marmoricola sp. RAF53 TaxID=3233059 RepID=UPI003F97F203
MTTASALPLLLTELRAETVTRISPTFVRVEFSSPELAHFGVDGPRYDQRFKLIFAAEGRDLPDIGGADESWLGAWLERPEAERGHLRTYTIREVLGDGEDTRFVVDFVVHEDGLAGPGAAWALAARPGDRVLTLAPRRGQQFGGIEFDIPDGADRLLLVGDETAVPAIASILTFLAPEARGHVFLEVPEAADVQDLVAPAGVELCWLVRGRAEAGSRVVPAVRAHVGLEAGEWAEPAEVDPDLWETPTYSSSGADVQVEPGRGRSADPATGLEGLYAWIAGESRMVTTLRRALVSELEVDRTRVAFMGYWRRGVAMRS